MSLFVQKKEKAFVERKVYDFLLNKINKKIK